MASELSRFIEQELERKGINPDDDRKRLLSRESFQIEKQSGSQDRAKRPPKSKAARNFCVGVCIFVAVVVLIYLLSRASVSNNGPVASPENKDSKDGTSASPELDGRPNEPAVNETSTSANATRPAAVTGEGSPKNETGPGRNSTRTRLIYRSAATENMHLAALNATNGDDDDDTNDLEITDTSEPSIDATAPSSEAAVGASSTATAPTPTPSAESPAVSPEPGPTTNVTSTNTSDVSGISGGKK